MPGKCQPAPVTRYGASGRHPSSAAGATFAFPPARAYTPGEDGSMLGRVIKDVVGGGSAAWPPASWPTRPLPASTSIRSLRLAPGHVEVGLSFRPEVSRQHDDFHGGVTATIAVLKLFDK